MRVAIHTRFSIFLSLVIWCFATSHAEGNYGDHPDTKALIDRMVSKHQLDAVSLQRIFDEAEKKQSILDAMSKPAEKRLDWSKYRKIFVTSSRTEQGKAFLKKHEKELVRAESELGVSRYIITAIIGVETLYGKRMGSHRVIDALSTLAFDFPRRSKFFTKELEQYLLLTREQGFDPLTIKGSYAGAMGFGQFIPSSYRHYAIDFDGDEVADLLGNVRDAIGSVANYFKVHGWKTGEPVAFETAVSGEAYEALLNDKLKLIHTVSDLKSAGVEIGEGYQDASKAKLLNLQGASGLEYWVALHNFYVITRYNHSRLYGMAVYQLSEAIKN